MNDKKHKKRELFDYTNDLVRNAMDILACIETLEKTKKSIEKLSHLCTQFRSVYRRDEPKYAIRCINYCCDSMIDVYETAIKEESAARLLHDMRFVKKIKRRVQQ